MKHALHYIPIPEPEDDETIVRRSLRALAKEMQQRGEIPAEVPETELYEAVEPRVSGFVKKLQSSPMYPHWKTSGHIEDHIRGLFGSL